MIRLTHRYWSTACQHELCDECRLVCKFCDATCLCDCHEPDPHDDHQRARRWLGAIVRRWRQ